MEIIQNLVVRIDNIEDSEAFYEFMEEEADIFFDEMNDDFEDSIEIEIMDAYEEFDNLINTLKAIVTEFPEIKLNIEGEEDTTYDGIKYEITYGADRMTIKTSKRFYKRYPEDYDEFVGFCEEFNIDDVIEEDEWETMNNEVDGEWYFIEGVRATENIELSEKQIIKF